MGISLPPVKQPTRALHVDHSYHSASEVPVDTCHQSMLSPLGSGEREEEAGASHLEGAGEDPMEG